MEVLIRIKRLILSGRYRFTVKALDELKDDGLEQEDAVESILNATFSSKTLRSTSPHRTRAGEKLFVIKSFNYSGTFIYTKGKFRQEEGEPVFDILISAKRSTIRD